MNYWAEKCSITYKNEKNLLCILMSNFKEFRNLFYNRLSGENRNVFIKLFEKICRFIYRPIDSLYVQTLDIGGGCFIRHGFATIIAAEKIGSNCIIHQQVTIGYNGKGNPTLGDNVMVGCGAKVLGKITVGNNVKIGANAVVISDVPDNATVVGVPARIIRRDN